jgi:hypothetical protein
MPTNCGRLASVHVSSEIQTTWRQSAKVATPIGPCHVMVANIEVHPFKRNVIGSKHSQRDITKALVTSDGLCCSHRAFELLKHHLLEQVGCIWISTSAGPIHFPCWCVTWETDVRFYHAGQKTARLAIPSYRTLCLCAPAPFHSSKNLVFWVDCTSYEDTQRLLKDSKESELQQRITPKRSVPRSEKEKCLHASFWCFGVEHEWGFLWTALLEKMCMLKSISFPTM